jgi:UDP-glucose 4-epimerase
MLYRALQIETLKSVHKMGFSKFSFRAAVYGVPNKMPVDEEATLNSIPKLEHLEFKKDEIENLLRD